MLKRLLANTEWKQLSAFVSPAFFDVIPTRKVVSRARQVRRGPDDAGYQRAQRLRAEALARLPMSIFVDGVATHEVQDGLPMDESGHAQRVVVLYFEQLFSDVPTLLDLRRSAFVQQANGLIWNPAPWVCEWDPTFIDPLREVYRGFYDGDDTRFRQGLQRLQLDAAEDLFRRYFSANEGQRFVTRDFVATFSEVFRRCRDAKVQLHPDFALLGIYLATLYDHLDQGPVVNVRSAYERVIQQAPESAQSGRSEGVAHA